MFVVLYNKYEQIQKIVSEKLNSRFVLAMHSYKYVMSACNDAATAVER